MQLHRLRLAAIGPFADEFEVDFAALSAGGLFLLEGPTGAGKSTLIDAIVYALYGDVAGTTSKDRIRSGFSGPETESFVDLVFETSSGVYRVRRTPEWWRAKKRGEGTTKVQAGAALWRLASPEDPDGGEHMSGRLDEIGAEIENAVGLSRAQFVQTIVLPQGEFATFLKAKPEARREVLQRVFGTADYELVQEHLAEAKRAVVARIAGAQRQVEDAVTGLCAVLAPFEDAEAGEALVAAAGGDLAEDSVLAELVTGHVASAETAFALAQQRVGDRRSLLARVRREVDGASARRDAARRVTELHAERGALLAGEAAQRERAERLAAARRAAAVVGAIAGVEKALVARDTANWALEELDVPVELRALEPAALTAARDEAQRATGGLTDAVAIAERVALRSRAQEEKRAQLAGLETSVAVLATTLAARPAVHAALAERLRDVRPLAEMVGQCEDRLAVAAGRLAASRAVVSTEVELVEARADVGRLAAEATKRVEEESRLRKSRIAGIAGELAQRLAPGDPCPVCGGAEHPSPAELSVEHADEDQVAAAEADREAADRALAAAKAELAEIESRLAVLRAAAGGLDEAAALLAHDDATTALTTARTALAERAKLEGEIATAERDDLELRSRSGELDIQVAALRSEIAALERQLAEDATALETARGDFDSVAERLEHLESRCEAADALLVARTRLAEARAQHTERVAELAEVLVEHRFTDADEARAASLTAVESAALEGEIGAYRDALARVTSSLAAPELVEAMRDPHGPDGEPLDLLTFDPSTLDLEALAGAVVTAEEQLTAAEAALGEATTDAAVHARRASEGARCRDELTGLLASSAEERAAAAPVIRMAELAAGSGADNPKRLTLATYVLLRRFEEVVDVANERLAVMSDGRYALERSDERESGGGLRQGLALRVRDHTIDALRDPHTLSGGETFYVSLCLALALAQVVTAEAGGVDLGTLFVDEGFGTLDPHVLEAVLGQLGSLHAEGRVVGIISHVAELKDTIAERIEVRPTPLGPSTLRVVA